jgi:hypothetical protein
MATFRIPKSEWQSAGFRKTGKLELDDAYNPSICDRTIKVVGLNTTGTKGAKFISGKGDPD